MAIGSIGPTRQRCLDQLRKRLEGDPLLDRSASAQGVDVPQAEAAG
jgi:hypothetical protein